MDFDPHTLIDRRDIGNQFEVLLSVIYHEFVKPGDVVIDGGSNGGLHSIPLARIVGKKGIVYAYEPQKTVLGELKRWATIDGMADIIVTKQVALSDTHGYKNLWVNTSNSALSSLLEPKSDNDKDWAIEIVETVKLDNENLRQPISFIKLDLEGGEYRALQGGMNLLKISKPIIAFENARKWAAIRDGYTSYEFFDLFSGLGFILLDFFGRPFTRLAWESDKIPWYFIAIESSDVRTQHLSIMINKFWRNIDNNSYLDDWTHVVSIVSGKERWC